MGINPRGSRREGHSIDGVLPDDQRRSGPFGGRRRTGDYVYGALQGALVQAVLLGNAGYDVWEWGDRALLRAFLWLHAEAGFSAQGDDGWEPWLINFHYGVRLPAPEPARPGKIAGWTDWTHRSDMPMRSDSRPRALPDVEPGRGRADAFRTAAGSAARFGPFPVTGTISRTRQ